MHFCDIFLPPQWGLRQPSRRNFVPFTTACSGLLVYIDIVSFPKHGADLLYRGQLYLCYVCLNIDSEYRVLESLNQFLGFLHYRTTSEYSRHFMLLYPTMCAWATWLVG